MKAICVHLYGIYFRELKKGMVVVNFHHLFIDILDALYIFFSPISFIVTYAPA